ncbi:hypothetical protein KC19_2G007300 [Ceratodon purpureus]|uniref:Uncharacterized protein n=1 Tax=Ceratodon purpureus TaxID=3225 RepID=A0A8T0IRU5_CERPU|nr:hypothetical protein KC19_2G007300 [Ceratodon purpureus]
MASPNPSRMPRWATEGKDKDGKRGRGRVGGGRGVRNNCRTMDGLRGGEREQERECWRQPATNARTEGAAVGRGTAHAHTHSAQYKAGTEENRVHSQLHTHLTSLTSTSTSGTPARVSTTTSKAPLRRASPRLEPGAWSLEPRHCPKVAAPQPDKLPREESAPTLVENMPSSGVPKCSSSLRTYSPL